MEDLGPGGTREPPVPWFRLTVRGAAIAVVAGGGWLLLALAPSRGRVLAPVAASATAVLLAGIFATIRAHARCRVAVATHAVPSVSEVGAAAVLRITITNRAPRPCTGAVVALAAGGTFAPMRSVVPVRSIGPGCSETIEVPLSTVRRGRQAGSPGRLWLLDPLVATGTAIAPLPAWSHVVVPVGCPQDDGPLPVSSGAHRHPASDRGGDGCDGVGELAGLRPYRTGDRLHHLHWPSLAPGRTPLVRTFGDAGPGEDVSLVIDDRSGVHRRDGFDRVLAACLGMVDTYHGWGLEVGVHTLSGRALPAPLGEGGRMELAVELAGLEPTRPVPDEWAQPGRPAAVVVTSPGGAISLAELLPVAVTVVVAP